MEKGKRLTWLLRRMPVGPKSLKKHQNRMLVLRSPLPKTLPTSTTILLVTGQQAQPNREREMLFRPTSAAGARRANLQRTLRQCFFPVVDKLLCCNKMKLSFCKLFHDTCEIPLRIRILRIPIFPPPIPPPSLLPSSPPPPPLLPPTSHPSSLQDSGMTHGTSP